MTIVAVLVAVLLVPTIAQAAQNMEWFDAVSMGSGSGALISDGVDSGGQGGFACVAGEFIGDVDFGPDTSGFSVTRSNNTGNLAGFVALYSTNPYTSARELEWVYTLTPNSSSDAVDITSVALVGSTPQNADCMVAGSIEGSVVFDDDPTQSSTTTLSALIGQDAFVSRFSASSRGWSRLLFAWLDATALDIEIAESRVVVGGYWDNSTGGTLIVSDDEPGQLGSNYLQVSGQGDREGYVAAFDLSGAPVWGHHVGAQADDEVRGVHVLDGSVWIAGKYEDEISLDTARGLGGFFYSYPGRGGEGGYLTRVSLTDGLMNSLSDFYESDPFSHGAEYNGVYADGGLVVVCGSATDQSGLRRASYHVLSTGFASVEFHVEDDTAESVYDACYIEGTTQGTIYGLGLGGSFDGTLWGYSSSNEDGVLRFKNGAGYFSTHVVSSPLPTQIHDLDFGDNFWGWNGRFPIEARTGWTGGLFWDADFETGGNIDFSTQTMSIVATLGYQ